jgi:DNA-binding XRE family transcriptional regulator
MFMKLWRTARDLSQVEAAQLIGIRQETWARHERKADPPKVIRLALRAIELSRPPVN